MEPRKSIAFLLRNTQSPLQLIAGVFGSFVGIFIVGLAVQLYAEYTHLISNQGNVTGYQFIIINKKVSALNTFKQGISQFSTEDLDKIRELGVVEDIGVFKSNQFSVEGILQIPGQNGGFGSEMFFESVEDQFIDQTPEDWNWKAGDETVPLILPTDFLNLYNFNFNFELFSGVRDYSTKVDFDYFPNIRNQVKFGGAYTFHTFTPTTATGTIGETSISPEKINRQYANEAAA